MMPDPSTVLRDLMRGEPVQLGTLPHDHGIYALHDHTGTIRYIGITKSIESGFFDRIHNRHVTGSEGRSHKFSHAYNTGRMWRVKRDVSPDACLAKRLRTEFIRRRCRATFVTLPQSLWAELPRLEIAVQALAPRSMLDWGGKRGFAPLSEPTELVDALLDDLRFTPDQRAAVERQAALHGARLAAD
ncbi:hypothetical protein [Rhodoligotrophos ferricapiens]|uniref:hypothetical protein n=1 Tax=Rhodoligotrophos ferricapiens TaxID=3069264 RepID=UPI00315CC1CB